MLCVRLPQSVPHRPSGHHHSSRSSGKGLTHHHAAKALGTSVDPYDQEIDSGSDDEDSATGIVVNPLEVEAASAMQSQVELLEVHTRMWVMLGNLNPLDLNVNVHLPIEIFSLCMYMKNQKVYLHNQSQT